MLITMFKGKIHRARVTEANLNYVGSITIDERLLEESGILPGEKVQIVNLNNGERLETYTIAGQADSGVVCLNGAAARLAQPDDLIIIIAYAMFDNQEEARNFVPKVVMVDENNKITKSATTHEQAGKTSI